jgi:hypothetical protein
MMDAAREESTMNHAMAGASERASSRCVTVTAICAVFVLVQATASGQNPENWCRHASFLHDPDFKVAEVVASDRSDGHFFRDDGACPDAANPACRQERFVAPGERVLVSRTYRTFACAWQQLPTGDEIVGWLPAESLKTIETARGSEEWAGAWWNHDNALRVERDAVSGRLRVTGQAYWHGGFGGTDVIHFGFVRAEAEPKGDKLDLQERDCRVTLRLLGSFLVASDNGRCGGVSVRFDGVYRKQVIAFVRRLEGATLGANIDLGQYTASEFGKLNISDDLKAALRPYVGKKGVEAEEFLHNHPAAALTKEQAKKLVEAVWFPMFDDVKRRFNEEKSQAVPLFNKLPGEAQTIIADLAVQYGPNLAAGCPTFWNLITHGQWADAAEELRHPTDKNGWRLPAGRRAKDADLLEQAITKGTLPKIAQ